MGESGKALNAERPREARLQCEPGSAMSRRILAVLFLLAVAASLACCFVPSASARSGGEGGVSLRFITEEYPPYNFTRDGEVTGLAVEMLRLMWDAMGEPHAPIEVMPWARGLHLLDEGPGVVLFNAAWSEERERCYQFVRPVLTGHFVVMARSSSLADPAPWISLDNDGGLTVGSVRDDITEQLALQQGLPLTCLDRAPDLDVNVRKFLHGRFPCILGESGAMQRAMDRLGGPPADLVTLYVLGTAENGFMFSADVPPEVVARYQKALEQVRRGPHFHGLVRRFMP